MVQEKIEHDKIQPHHSKENLNRSNKDICEDYLRSPRDFEIYFENTLLFDSFNSDRSNVIFFENSFSIYGKHFPYKGMVIKKKKSDQSTVN